MKGYVIRRLLSSVGVVAGLLLFVFIGTYYIGDPVFLMVDRELNTAEDRQALVELHGFDRPAYEQFLDFASDAVRGDFGNSLFQNRPASEVVIERIPATMMLAAAALLVTFAIAIPAATLAARNPGRWPETLITSISTALASIASFWLALGLIFIFAVKMSILPTSGYGSWQQIILPALALALPATGQITQIIHASMVDEFRQPYVAVARSKGLRELVVVRRHVLKNTAIVTITVLGAMLAALLNGAVLIESIFAWPGLGQVGLQAVHQRDLPVLSATVFYVGVTVTGVNLAIDLAYAYLDPRIRLS